MTKLNDMKIPILFGLAVSCFAADPFIVKPYLQLGDAPKQASSESMAVMWHTADQDADFRVSSKSASSSKWTVAKKPEWRRVAVRTIEPHRVWSAKMTGLKPGEAFDYRVERGGETVFTSHGMARKSAAQPYQFAVFGDCGQDSPAQKQIAKLTLDAKPDFVLLAGDIVYTRGKISEYRPKHFGVYNSEETPLLRSTLFIGAPGNHDIATPDLTANPDAQAFYYYWRQPMNGPHRKFGDPNSTPITGDDADVKAFLEAAGTAFPSAANFSFDYGNAHWLVLDSNPYVDMTDAGLQAWIRSDMKAARTATWRFVAFHHPGFNSSKSHFKDQQLRKLSPLFEELGVDVVFAGHVHNYQRTFPLTFVPAADAPRTGEVGGTWTLDKDFDGAEKSRPKGIIYLVTGGGGAKLYNPEQQDDPASWQPFTDKFISKKNSFTSVVVNGKSLSFRQIADDGSEVDQFKVTK
jgi:predicted phosphodiesterase